MQFQFFFKSVKKTKQNDELTFLFVHSSPDYTFMKQQKRNDLHSASTALEQRVLGILTERHHQLKAASKPS